MKLKITVITHKF
ncbi:hypothetical protein MTR67_018933 [Solanum verrucosum]|uniref:Uncharacterized protein n=1 Tax=Solanum verrucosum TaxID=315347 RepID=A0AAF0QNI1_SOLVR|nr:hypothetical protein MTR67_018933 [Solanum verrucosum]